MVIDYVNPSNMVIIPDRDSFGRKTGVAHPGAAVLQNESWYGLIVLHATSLTLLQRSRMKNDWPTCKAAVTQPSEASSGISIGWLE